ncbi:MAG: ECF transporter S component [Clostridia bacterium]|nr:ECF transporter S component [Clostridia bacterium]
MNTLNYTKKTIITGLCAALCVVLPMAFHSVPDGGSIFSPMHIPVLLCGLICGWQYGLVVGIIGPFLSSVIMQMPPIGYLAPMMVELAVYGFVSGAAMKFIRTGKYMLNVFISLISAMILGRVVAGVAKALVFSPGAITVKAWAVSYFAVSLPGIVLQLVLIPPLVLALRRAKVIPSEPKSRSEFERLLCQQYKLHPSMKPRDAVKLCYQAAFGAEHLLSDINAAKSYLFEEFERIEGADLPLFEQISAEICRVNIAAWKHAGLKKEWLFNMFCGTVREKRGSPELFKSYLETAKATLNLAGFDEFLADYVGGAVHHSEEYRTAEHPAYRIVDTRYARLIPILQKITADTHVIALDGRAASGKTTAAGLLSSVLDAPVVHMDDFFLPPALRTPERFLTPGNNVHHERFAKEVLPHLNSKDAFSYRIFDCGTMDYGEYREVKSADIRIVEGAYSLHPAFGCYADVKVFFDVEKGEQMRRIVTRNGKDMAQMFEKRWIPLEEEYYNAYNIEEKADVIVK